MVIAVSVSIFVFWQWFVVSTKPVISEQVHSIVIVAVIDTGVDINNRELEPYLWRNTKEIPNNGIDDDDNGYIDDYYGFNAVENSGSAIDKEGHGTGVSTIALGESTRGIHMSPLLRGYIKVLPIRSLVGGTWNSSSGLIKGMEYALALKKKTHLPMVMNISWVMIG